MHNLQAIVLAAGKSTRFKTGTSKLLEKICGQEMILYPISVLESLHIPTIVVVGFQKEEILACLEQHTTLGPTVVTQEEQRGTGHAVQCTEPMWNAEHILILNGDVPLITQELVRQLYEQHNTTQAAVTFITAHLTEPSSSYGRVINKDGNIKIVEAHEFTGDSHEHCCINAGIYLMHADFLHQALKALTSNNSRNELYLTDIIGYASHLNLPVKTLNASYDQIRGVNTLKELWAVEQIKRSDLINYWMLNGVRFSSAQNVHIDLNVSIGAGTIIGAGVQLRSGTTIGEHCTIGDFSCIERSTISSNVTIYSHCVITDSIIETAAHVGPFAHLRNNTVIGSNSTIGNFVEIKKSTIGAHTKAKHLSYLGDAHVGKNVNIGAGTITCNHNGVRRNSTFIQDGAYIGTNNSLVAPVTVGKNAYTAAGSTITNNVPNDALAIARSRQVNKEGYVPLLKEKIAAQQPAIELQSSQSSTVEQEV